jgi:hypothetical protein
MPVVLLATHGIRELRVRLLNALFDGSAARVQKNGELMKNKISLI